MKRKYKTPIYIYQYLLIFKYPKIEKGPDTEDIFFGLKPITMTQKKKKIPYMIHHFANFT